MPLTASVLYLDPMKPRGTPQSIPMDRIGNALQLSITAPVSVGHDLELFYDRSLQSQEIAQNGLPARRASSSFRDTDVRTVSVIVSALADQVPEAWMSSSQIMPIAYNPAPFPRILRAAAFLSRLNPTSLHRHAKPANCVG